MCCLLREPTRGYRLRHKTSRKSHTHHEVLEHWALGFAPHHPLLLRTLRYITEHLAQAHSLGKHLEAGFVTGQGPYARALYDTLLEEVHTLRRQTVTGTEHTHTHTHTTS